MSKHHDYIPTADRKATFGASLGERLRVKGIEWRGPESDPPVTITYENGERVDAVANDPAVAEAIAELREETS